MCDLNSSDGADRIVLWSSLQELQFASNYGELTGRSESNNEDVAASNLQENCCDIRREARRPGSLVQKVQKL